MRFSAAQTPRLSRSSQNAAHSACGATTDPFTMIRSRLVLYRTKKKVVFETTDLAYQSSGERGNAAPTVSPACSRRIEQTTRQNPSASCQKHPGVKKAALHRPLREKKFKILYEK